MAGSSFFALFDDIATLLDDIAVMSKVAAKKTAGVLGDDLALNAQQVAGVKADRELPVVWAVAKGSMLNKCLLVPAALAISAIAPWLIIPLLMLGGSFLCYEGAHKVLHVIFHKKEVSDHKEAIKKAVADTNVDMVAFEKKKITGAIRTDFILSAEIIVIALGTVADRTLGIQAAVLSVIAIGITVGVYGLVAAIVKMDDAGLHLLNSTKSFARAIGKGLLLTAPKLMKALSILGTTAMFLVGGGILVHGVPWLAEQVHHLEKLAHALPAAGVMAVLVANLAIGIIGFVAGCILVFVIGRFLQLLGKGQPSH